MAISIQIQFADTQSMPQPFHLLFTPQVPLALGR
jgi:hypothetical protein